MMLVLMRKLACNASYPNMHIISLILCVIIQPLQSTYHHINIHMPASMITHVANPKANGDTITWRMKQVGGGKI